MLSCMKFVVIIYNFLFWLLGVVLLATTIFLYVDVQHYVSFEDTSELYMTPFLLFIALGAIMTLVGFLGCCGAIRESSCLLATYFLLCVTMCVACGAAVWWSTEHGDSIRDRLQKDILKVVREKYGRGYGAMESIVDQIQTDFQCCGVKGPQDWATSFYNSPNKSQVILDYGVVGGVVPAPPGIYKVPASCCVRGWLNCEKDRSEVPLDMAPRDIRGIDSAGCWEGINRYVEEQWKWIIVVAVLVIAVQFFALLFACCLCCAISRGDDK